LDSRIYSTQEISYIRDRICLFCTILPL